MKSTSIETSGRCKPDPCELELASDVPAERVVVGCAIDSPATARFAADLECSHFTTREHRSLWQAAVSCEIPYRFDGCRTREIAKAANVAVALAEELRTKIPLLDDRTGYYAGRLQDARRHRRLQALLADRHDFIGLGGRLPEEAMVALERALSIAGGDPVGVLAGPEALVHSA